MPEYFTVKLAYKTKQKQNKTNKNQQTNKNKH